MKYEKLMNAKPTVLYSAVNEMGQRFDLVEDPINGDSAEVIVVFPELKLAGYSGFYETADMELVDGVDSDYTPRVVGGRIIHKYES